MCQNRDRSYRNAERTLRVYAPSIIRRVEGEKGLGVRAWKERAAHSPQNF